MRRLRLRKTKIQREKIKAKKLREKKKQQRLARKERDRKRTQARKLKRHLEAAPRRSLAQWSAEGLAQGYCDVCGIGVVTKMVDGKPKLNKKGKPILIHLNCHHVLAKESYPQFRTEPLNRVVLCPRHHKYYRHSFHRGGVWAAVWLMKHKPETWEWAVANMGRERLRLV